MLLPARARHAHPARRARRRAGRERERHGHSRRDPLRRQRHARGARELSGLCRPVRHAVRHRRALHGARWIVKPKTTNNANA